MRVTTSLFYQSSKSDYQKSMQSLYSVNNQISSGMKIQNSYEDSGIYVDTMRLDYELATLEQVSETSSKAQTFANNTDEALNQFTDTLTEFRTTLIQAANSTNSTTSREALADELEALRDHMISLANTSINGQFLFGGSALSTQPVDSNGNYNGNDESITALIGSGVQLAYNINGQDLFLGTDNDYYKTVSTNVPMYNQTLLYPEQMGGSEASQEVFLTENDSIRDMVGDTADETTGGDTAVFYISGRDAEGNTFSEQLELSFSANVSDLLEQIGNAYGNTSTNSVVDVSMNDYGQIEIQDLSAGNSLIEFSIFGAVDRKSTGGSGDALQSDVDDLLAYNNVDIISFTTSDFLNENTASTITSNQDIYNPGVFTLGSQMTLSDGTAVTTTTTLQSFMGSDINQIQFSGDDNSGSAITSVPPTDVLNIDSTTTVDDLLTQIETVYGVSARLEDGQIYLEVGDTTDYSLNQLNVQLDAFQGAGDGEIQSVTITGAASADGNITVTLANTATVDIAILNGDTEENIAQKVEAAAATLMAADANIAAVYADGDRIVIDYLEASGSIASNFSVAPNATGSTYAAGVEDQAYIEPDIAEVQSFTIKDNSSAGGTITIAGQNIVIGAADTTDTIATNIGAALGAVGSIDSIAVDGSKVTVTYNKSAGDVASNFLSATALTGLSITDVTTDKNFASTSSIEAFATTDVMNYERRSLDKDGNELLGNISQVVKDTNEYATATTKLVDVGGIINTTTNESTLDGEQFILSGVDNDGNDFEVQIDLSNSGSTFSINGGVDNYNILNSSGVATSADEMTYQQLLDIVSMVTSGNLPEDTDTTVGISLSEYNAAVKTSQKQVEVNLDYKGRLQVIDNTTSVSDIELSIYDSNADDATSASALSFMANDAVTIDEPTIDFFKDLDEIIDAVRNGTSYMDGTSDDPRNLGIENAIARLDHIADHVTKEHTVIGAYSNALESAQERAELLSVNVQTVRSEVIDVDLAEAYLQFQQVSNSYQAMLSTVSQINSMSLLQYM